MDLLENKGDPLVVMTQAQARQQEEEHVQQQKEECAHTTGWRPMIQL